MKGAPSGTTAHSGVTVAGGGENVARHGLLLGNHPAVIGNILIYGATGYTGKLAGREAREKGLKPILAGRTSRKVRAVAEPFGLKWRAFDLADTAQLDIALHDVAVVLCAAGPFSATSRPMAVLTILRLTTKAALSRSL